MRERVLMVLVALAATGPVSASAADRVACRDLERRFETQRGNLTALEINNLLFAAADRSCEALIAPLIDGGASPEARDREGNRALARAARAGSLAAVRLLLERGAPVDARNIAGSTALYLAAERDREQAVEILVAAGADVDLPGRSGARALAAAAYNGAESAVAALLAHGAQADAADASGKPAAAYAAGAGWPRILARLIAAGADVNRGQGSGTSLLAWAAGPGDGVGEPQAAETVRLLLEKGARLEDADERGYTPLMVAAEGGRVEIARILLAAGASRTARGKDGKIAADLARDTEFKQLLAPL